MKEVTQVDSGIERKTGSIARSSSSTRFAPDIHPAIVMNTSRWPARKTRRRTANAAARADRTGLYACPHTGVALAALFKLIERGEIKSSDRVIVISTAHGLKFTDFKVDYHDEALKNVICRHANPPLELPADYAAVSAAIDRAIQELNRRQKTA